MVRDFRERGDLVKDCGDVRDLSVREVADFSELEQLVGQLEQILLGNVFLRGKTFNFQTILIRKNSASTFLIKSKIKSL